ncbi:MAG: hypothetical protein AAGB97_04545 [Dehalococcoidia bacterium]
MTDKYIKIRDLLLQHGNDIKSNYVASWLDQKPLSVKNANKFFLGAIIDYQIHANTAWGNARRLSEEILGDPPKLWDHIVNSYTRDEWASKWREFRVHRFPKAHDRIWRIGYEIVKRYDGDVRNIWQGKNSDAIVDALERMRCGPEISRMIVGLLITYKQIDGKSDVEANRHVCKVLGRVFNRDLDPEAARQLARKIHPDNPWQLDIAIYDIGKKYCLFDWCYCDTCPIGKEDKCEDYRSYRMVQDRQ